MTAPTRAVHAGPGGLPAVAVAAPDGARALVALHGAHVLEWQPAGGGERLYLSPRAEYREGVPIRGGVPVIFPQFADVGPSLKHGFARRTAWALSPDAAGQRAAGASVTLRLADSPATRAVWPHAFAAELTVRVGGAQLEVTLAVANTGAARLAFTAALHTYLRVADVASATVRGLRGVRYRDSAAGGREATERAAALAFAGEVDRIYLDAPPSLELWSGDAPTLTVGMTGFRDTVVWNPGAEGAAALADLEPGGHARFVCVEAAVIGTPVTLDAGARWRGAQTLTARD
jgi:glucose-6-phosphate 1-epimerase